MVHLVSYRKYYLSIGGILYSRRMIRKRVKRIKR